ncbi:hypothetical protein SD37_12925 [Amycolatopsis orientalis]|uniref:Uncharacterized protein n=1 Tax=Amycolatopsis orientalis TaxID=31958 RepID=A0A193BWA8_AMYOR|nr:hypothetical protein SD37_12925 [Amycolatopsis orientalis]
MVAARNGSAAPNPAPPRPRSRPTTHITTMSDGKNAMSRNPLRNPRRGPADMSDPSHFGGSAVSRCVQFRIAMPSRSATSAYWTRA